MAGYTAAGLAGLGSLGAAAYYGPYKSWERSREVDWAAKGRAAKRWEKVFVNAEKKFPGLRDPSYGGRQKYGPALELLKTHKLPEFKQLSNLHLQKGKNANGKNEVLYGETSEGPFYKQGHWILQKGYTGARRNARLKKEPWGLLEVGRVVPPLSEAMHTRSQN